MRLTPVRLLIILAAAVYLAETGLMLILAQFPAIPREIQAVIDATVLLMLLSPAYFFLFLPLKRHYAAHIKADQEIRHLSRQMLRAVESERKRLARDLHDECGQTLTALQFGIQTLRNSLPHVGAEEGRQFDYLRELVGRLSEHMREITTELRPPLLEDCALVATLRWHVQQLAKNSVGFDIELDLEDCPQRLDADIEIALFRVCQEGLNNIAKHARATRAKVRLICDSRRVGLILEDDGQGFLSMEGKETSEIAGIGIIGMRERMAALGGKLEIRSAPGKGTRMWAEIPLQTKDVHEADPYSDR